jgi:hypothetical protein
MNEVEAAWFLSKFEEKFTPNTKLANALRRYNVSIRPTPIAFSKHEAGAHQYPYLYG